MKVLIFLLLLGSLGHARTCNIDLDRLLILNTITNPEFINSSLGRAYGFKNSRRAKKLSDWLDTSAFEHNFQRYCDIQEAQSKGKFLFYEGLEMEEFNKPFCDSFEGKRAEIFAQMNSHFESARADRVALDWITMKNYSLTTCFKSPDDLRKKFRGKEHLDRIAYEHLLDQHKQVDPQFRALFLRKKPHDLALCAWTRDRAQIKKIINGAESCLSGEIDEIPPSVNFRATILQCLDVIKGGEKYNFRLLESDPQSPCLSERAGLAMRDANGKAVCGKIAQNPTSGSYAIHFSGTTQQGTTEESKFDIYFSINRRKDLGLETADASYCRQQIGSRTVEKWLDETGTLERIKTSVQGVERQEKGYYCNDKLYDSLKEDIRRSGSFANYRNAILGAGVVPPRELARDSSFRERREKITGTWLQDLQQLTQDLSAEVKPGKNGKKLMSLLTSVSEQWDYQKDFPQDPLQMAEQLRVAAELAPGKWQAQVNELRDSLLGMISAGYAHNIGDYACAMNKIALELFPWIEWPFERRMREKEERKSQGYRY